MNRSIFEFMHHHRHLYHKYQGKNVPFFGKASDNSASILSQRWDI